MSFDFSHLKRYEVGETRSAQYPLSMLEGEPVLTVRPATQANKAYFNALLKRARNYAQQRRNGNVTAETMAQNRDEDRNLYARHVVTDWAGVVDSRGQAVPFSEEACHEFLHALPDWVFDDLRTFAAEPRNFIQEADDGELDPEETGND